MDYSKLAQITDSLITGKAVVVEKSERDYKNPTEQLNKLLDSSKSPKVVTKKITQIVICDEKFMKEFSASPRSKKKEFLSKMSDAQRTRFLKLKHKMCDSGFSERLGYILLDNLVYNFLTDPSAKNESDLREFMETQEYCDFSEDITNEVEGILDGSVETPEHLVSETKEVTGNSSVESIIKEPEEPTYDEPTDEELQDMEDAAREIAVEYDVTQESQQVSDSIESYVSKQKKNFNKVKVRSTMYNMVLDSISKEPYDYGEAIKDEDLDKLFEQSKSEEHSDDSILDKFVNALEQYKEGNQEPLNELINTDTTEDTDLEDIADEPEQDPSEDDETENNEFLDDAVSKAAFGILHCKKANKALNVINKFTNSHVCDAYLCTEDYYPEDIECEQVTGVPDVPLDINEYHTLVQNPIGVPLIEQAMENTAIPVVKTCEPFNGLVNVNEGCLYYPIAGSADEICADSEHLEGKVVSVDALFRAAAVQDCLSAVSKGFYKKKLTSTVWSFDKDKKPWCIPDSYKSTSLKRVLKGQEDIMILGSPYKYV